MDSILYILVSDSISRLTKDYILGITTEFNVKKYYVITWSGSFGFSLFSHTIT